MNYVKTFLCSRTCHLSHPSYFLPILNPPLLHLPLLRDALDYLYTMTSPSDSARLFFSSSPTRYSSGPAEEVDTILAQVQQVDQLDPSINAILSVNRVAFFDTFSRRVQLIKSRSQAFQDSHVTVFDKVLLVLTQNGKELDTAAAISYFCEEHLGIPKDAPSAQKKAIVPNALIAPATLTQGML